MKSRRWFVLALAVVVLPLRSEGQVPGNQGQTFIPQTGGFLAPPMNSGAWAEVITATPKWLVIQNADGQQFPVSLSRQDIGLFVVRWPTTPSRLTPNSVVEVAGIDLGSNRVLSGHLDVFEPDAQSLLGGYWPSVLAITAAGRVQTPYAADQNASYNGWDAVYLISGEAPMPSRYHIVAPVGSVDPMTLAVGNGNFYAIVPPTGGTHMSRVTLGSANYVRPGDLVYFIPVQATAKGLVLSQLVVYKDIPFDQFGP